MALEGVCAPRVARARLVSPPLFRLFFFFLLLSLLRLFLLRLSLLRLFLFLLSLLLFLLFPLLPLLLFFPSVLSSSSSSPSSSSSSSSSPSSSSVFPFCVVFFFFFCFFLFVFFFHLVSFSGLVLGCFSRQTSRIFVKKGHYPLSRQNGRMLRRGGRHFCRCFRPQTGRIFV